MVRPSEREHGLTLAEITRLVGGALEGPGELRITGAADLTTAGAGEIAFCTGGRRLAQLDTTGAAAVLVPTALDVPSQAPPVVRVQDPYLAMAQVLQALCPRRRQVLGIHPSATVAEDARLGEDVGVGAGAVIGPGASIGERSEIGPGTIVGAGVRIGAECVLYPSTTLYEGTRLGDRVIVHAGAVIGADGFGFARDGARQVKVLQRGGVLIEDDVEIGANACIDRGTFGVTRIGRGTKIDNLVQIGHNCDLGQNCAISGLAGLSGSTVLEDGVILGGNVGTAGHQIIGAGVMVAAKSGVHGDVAPGQVVGGYPHMPVSLWRRVVGALPKLPELIRRVRRLERRLDETDR